jgi:hypothetical protein
MKAFEDGDISARDQDKLMKLTRIMYAEASKLIAAALLSDAEAVPWFIDKLDTRFREKILENLETDPPPLPDGAPEVNKDKRTWTLKEVIDEAKRIAKHQTRQMDFFSGGKSKPTSSGRAMSPRPVKQENAADAAAMLEAIKLATVNI